METKQEEPITSCFTTNYILRKTNEQVEVVAFNIEEDGNRSENDWVSYIDSNGIEHIKENLNIKFDFIVKAELPDFMKNMFNTPSLSSVPSTDNYRMFDMAKELYINYQMTMPDAINKAVEFVNTFNNIVIEK